MNVGFPRGQYSTTTPPRPSCIKIKNKEGGDVVSDAYFSLGYVSKG